MIIESNIAVRCHEIVKIYGQKNIKTIALHGVNLEVRKGELLMIVGPSGCGKTTLISIIAAIIEQDDGDCEVYGVELKNLNQKDKLLYRGKSIGFVFQAFNLLPALTAVENVSIPLLINGARRWDAEKRARDVLESVELGDHSNALPSHLSGGQQQRVAIARAIVHNPKLVICDEPTSNLDHETGYKMINTLRDIAKSPDRTVIIVTHDTRIIELADRVAEMDD